MVEFDALNICKNCGCVFVQSSDSGSGCPTCKNYLIEIIMTKVVEERSKSVKIILEMF